MKFIRIVSGCLGIFFLLTAPAYAYKPYLSGKLGFNARPDTHLGAADVDPDPGISLLAAIGVEAETPFRLEGEISLYTNGYDAHNRFTGARFTGHYTLVNFMANGYFDPVREGPFRPYVGAGLGFGAIGVSFDTSLGPTSDSAIVGSFQGILGMEYFVNSRTALLAEYRYVMTSDPDLNYSGIVAGTEYESYNFLIGVRVFFSRK